MIAAPGSTLWLLRHELRLDWRRRTAARGPARYLSLTVTLGAPVFLAVFVGLPLAVALDAGKLPSGAEAAAVAAMVLAASFMLMLSQALASVVDALYDRGDLELLFASPVAPVRVVAVRALAIAFQAFSVFGYFAAGPLAALALLGRPGWLASLAVLFAAALAATGVALVLALGLIRLAGPRRTRTLGHLAAVVVGAGFFLATQVATLTAGGGAGPGSALSTALRWAGTPGFRPPAFLNWSLRALSGDPAATLAAVGLCLGVFLASLWAAGPPFATLAAAAAGAGRGVRRRTAGRTRRFRGDAFAATLRKELRLLLRDPMLLPQVLLRVIYLVPVGFIAVRYGAAANFTALAGSIVALTLMANQLAASLAWITVSAEDAPALLASSPAAPAAIVQAKLSAVALTVGAILAPVLGPLLTFAPVEGLAAVIGCAVAVAAASLVNLWWQRPGKRTEFRKRASAPWFVTLAELALGLSIALGAGLLAARQPAGLAPLALAAALLLGLRALRPRSA